jgi:hypothetical protein
MCRRHRDPENARRRTNGSPDCERARSSGEASDQGATECVSAACVEALRPTGVAHHRALRAEDSAPTHKRFHGRYSKGTWSLKRVCKQDSTRLPTASETLANTGGGCWNSGLTVAFQIVRSLSYATVSKSPTVCLRTEKVEC